MANGNLTHIEREKVVPHPSRVAEDVAAQRAPEIENPISHLQAMVGNQAVQRLLAQRSAPNIGGAFELDDDTASVIDAQRGHGAALESSVQAQMERQTGYDLSGVHVHTDETADALSRTLGAKAFTTGSDIFFREGAYAPRASAGQELLTHELTHVVQQGTGQVSGHARMTVHAPDDTFEREADHAAQEHSLAETSVQRDVVVEEDEVQAQRDAVQRGMPAEDESLMLQEEDEEEELQMQQEEEEEEEIQTELVFDEEITTE